MRPAVRAIRWAFALAGAALLTAACSTNARSPGVAPKGEAKPALVEVLQPDRRDVTRRIDLVGTLMPWEEATLYAKTSGYLQSIHVDRGDRVKKGQVIAVLDIPEMKGERAQLEARVRLALADVEREKADVRLQEATVRRLQAIRAEEPGATTDQELDLASERLAAAAASLAVAESRVGVALADLERLAALESYSLLTAPLDGIVTDRFLDAGALVTAGTQSKPTPVARVVDSSKLRLTVDVPESDVAWVGEGKLARLRVDALPDRLFDGKITRFSRALDPRTRTMRTEILVDNPDGFLAAGMFARVSIDLEQRDDVLALPPSCVHFQKDQAYVFVVDQGSARRVNVVCGADDGNAIEIVSGLRGAESVVVSAPGSLTDGAPIAVGDRTEGRGGS